MADDRPFVGSRGGGGSWGPQRRTAAIVGIACCLVHLALLAICGAVLWKLQAWKGHVAQRDASYGVILSAACPRCALQVQEVRDDLELAQIDHGNAGFWLLWTLLPSVQLVILYLQRLQEQTVLISALLVVLVITLVTDVLYVLFTGALVLKGKILQALAFDVGYAVRLLMLWAVALLFNAVYSRFFNGSHRLLLALFFLVVLLLRCQVLWALVEALRDPAAHGEPERLLELLFKSIEKLAVMSHTGMMDVLSEAKPKWCEGAMAFLLLLGVWAIFLLFVALFEQAPTWAIVSLNALLVLQFFDLALAEVFLLESLRHKTGLGNWLRINVQGAVAVAGGADGGGEADMGRTRQEHCRGEVYVFKDTFYGEFYAAIARLPARRFAELLDSYKLAHEDELPPKTWACTEEYINERLDDLDWSFSEGLHQFSERAIANNRYAFLAGRNELSRLLTCRYYQQLPSVRSQEALGRKLLLLPAKLLACGYGLLLMALPAVKFRCSLGELATQGFQNDELYAGKAWYTEEDLPPWWIGIVGTLCQRARSARAPHPPRSKRRALAKGCRGLAFLAALLCWGAMVDVSRSCFALVVLLYI